MEGLLIAKQSVAGKLVPARLGNMTVRVVVPKFEESVLAREHVFVSVH